MPATPGATWRRSLPTSSCPCAEAQAGIALGRRRRSSGSPFHHAEERILEKACMDLERVLVREIWIAFAEATGIEDVRATTRDIPDYDVLMRQRLAILDRHGLCLAEIQEVIAGLEPMAGAREFLDWLRERFQVVILSDTFYEFRSEEHTSELQSRGHLV